MSTISQQKIKNFNLIIPPLSEQQQIVSFLDTKTSLIDSLIEKTKQKIELLKEKRTSLINEVVTKGLNPNVEMKNSGVEWIGEIPSHWETGKLKNNSDLKISSIDKHIFEEEIQVIVCNYTDVYYNEFITPELPLRKGSCSENEYSNFILKRGDVIITKDSESPTDIGVPSLVKENLDNVVCGYHLSIIKSNPKKLVGGYLFRQLQTNRIRSYFEINSNGITRFGLGKSSVLETPLILPPLNEQQQIVEYLDKQTQNIDKTISIEEKRIELLKEYRQSLISEVVTGKRKVVEDNYPIIKNSLSVTLPYKILNPKYEKKVFKTSSGETITTQTGEEYLKPKKELIDFLNKELSNLVTTKNQKDSIERFFKESFFRLKHSLPFKGSYEHKDWNILKGKDGSILSNYYFTSGIMEDMKPNWERFIFKLNGEIDEFTDNIHEDNFIEKFRIYR